MDSDLFEEGGELFEFGDAERGEGTADGVADGFFEGAQEGGAFRGEVGVDDAAIGGGAGAKDEAALFHAVEEARHIGVAGDHAGGDFAAGEAGGAGAGEDTEDVVLGVGEAEGLEGFLDAAEEPGGGPLEIEEGLFGGMGEGAGLSNFGLETTGHVRTIPVATTTGKGRGVCMSLFT